MRLSNLPRPLVRGALAAATAAALLTALTGCSEEKETMAGWSKKGGGDHATAIAQDVKTLLQASGSSPANAGDCRRVLDDVKAAKAFRTVPDEIARTSWEQALDQMEVVATKCVSNSGTTLSEVIPAQTSFHLFADRYSQLLGSAR